MALLRRKFTPFIGLEGHEPPLEPLEMGSLVERFRVGPGPLGVISDPIARTAHRIRSLFRKRSRRPLVLDLPGKTLVFSSPAEFEFGLASRIEFPVRKAARLISRSADDIQEMALKLRAIEKHFAGMFARCLERPDEIGAMLRDLGSGLLSRDHDWRDIVAALNRHGPDYDDYKHIALVKYMQYLASRQAVVRSIYMEKTKGQRVEPLLLGADGEPAEGSLQAAAPSQDQPLFGPLKETALFDLEGPAGGGSDPQEPQSLKPMPRGETICVRFIDGLELDVRLASHHYKLFPGKHFYMVDEGTGVTHPLRPGRNVIGRHSGNEVVVDSGYLAISRKHLIVEPLSDNAALLTDISSHGTFITPQYV